MLSKNLFVFPTNRAIRDHIALKKESNQLLDQTLSIGDFFSKIIIPNDEKIYVDQDIRIIVLKEALKNLDVSALGIEKSFTKLFSSSEYIFKFFQELAQEKKHIDDIDIIDTYEFYHEHLSLLKQVYNNYTALLDSYGYVDNITIVNNYKINEDFLDYFENIYLMYEGYFSSFEIDLIKSVSQRNELLIYLHLNQFNKKNIHLFKHFDVDLEVGHEYIINISTKSIESKIQNTNHKENKHSIYPVNNRIEQIAVVKKSITEMIEKNIDPSKIAVILPDEKFAHYLKLFDSENYFNFAMGIDIFNTTFYKKIKTIQEYLNNEEPKYKIKAQFVHKELEYIETHIKPFWNKQISKEIFLNIFNQILQSEENEQLLEKLLELAISLERLLFAKELSNENITLKDGFKILLKKLAAISLDDVKSGKITVLGILETRFASFDGVVIIDFNDDTIPKRSIKDKFFSSKVKEQVGLPSSKERESLQKYYYKRVIDKAKEVCISYVDSQEKSMSRFVNELFTIPKIQRKDFSKILQNKHFLHTDIKDIVLQIDLSKQKWSASRLKTYLTCKRRYYFHYILNIKEHDISLEPKNYEIGNIIHTVLENVVQKNPLSYSYEDIKKEINNFQNINPYITFELELWKKRLKKFYDVEQTLRLQNEKAVEFEKFFDFEYKGINLTGRIDRIDKNDMGKHFIYDYKTSKTLKIDTAKNYMDSNDFQLEFYYLATRAFDVDFVGYYDLFNGEIKKENMLLEKIELLDKYLATLKTSTVSFEMCENKSHCEFCPYKILCNRS